MCCIFGRPFYFFHLPTTYVSLVITLLLLLLELCLLILPLEVFLRNQVGEISRKSRNSSGMIYPYSFISEAHIGPTQHRRWSFL